ncbi:MAG: dTDP-4-dehydrorhamnose reductase [Paracoccus sp. (in: a-proteobacteria)]|nr:dTDP-4-dehydrorhamnose reductase [Paracoccus sp. (in: a-proteobacteria)]
MDGLLIFGQSGQVARELALIAPRAHFAGRDQADLSRPASCGLLIDRLRPRAVINAAAYTAVDRAESEPDLARAVNAQAPGHMALACARLGIPLIHISTDYVFDGSGDAPRDETAETGPLGVYGATKLEGEDAVTGAGGQWAILRTSWVFSAHGTNFLRTMLRLGATRDAMRIVADQTGGPTPATAIARALIEMTTQMLSDPDKGGIYHFAGGPDVTWAGFAREIFARAGMEVAIEEITTAQYPTPATRPLNSRLDCSAIARDFGIARPDWREVLDQIITNTATGHQP